MTFSFKQWYIANGDRLNKGRRARYKTDPDYRRQVLERNKASRTKRLEGALQERIEENDAKLISMPSQPWKAVEAQDSKTKLLTIGALAKATGRSVQVLRSWERQGIIPKATQHNAKGDRLYSIEMIESIVGALKSQGRLGQVKLQKRYSSRGVSGELLFADGTVEHTKLFRVGALARALGKNSFAIEQLEAKGYIPSTPFRDSRVQYRLYTIGMIEAVVSCLSAYPPSIRGEAQWKKIHASIEEAWEALGLLSAKFIPQEKE